jgi:hypothetical protein
MWQTSTGPIYLAHAVIGGLSRATTGYTEPDVGSRSRTPSTMAGRSTTERIHHRRGGARTDAENGDFFSPSTPNSGQIVMQWFVRSILLGQVSPTSIPGGRTSTWCAPACVTVSPRKLLLVVPRDHAAGPDPLLAASRRAAGPGPTMAYTARSPAKRRSADAVVGHDVVLLVGGGAARPRTVLSGRCW